MEVVKRNGAIVPFDGRKIQVAIRNAGEVSDNTVRYISLDVGNRISLMGGRATVEQIQDMVEDNLMKLGYRDVARDYIRYRQRREIARSYDGAIDSILHIVEANNQDAKDENANKNPEILSTQRDYIAGEVSRSITSSVLLPPDIADAHKAGIIHFHDADYFVQNMHNCCLVNLEDMLQNGTVISKTLIERPHSFSTACNIATQIMAQVASNQYGGQSESLSHLAPFVDVSRRKIHAEVTNEVDEGIRSGELDLIPGSNEYCHYINSVTERRVRSEVHDGVQTIQYQINTLLTSNGQTPFVTIWMYLDEVPEGRTRDDLAMIIEEVIRQRYQGTKNEKGVWITPAFPKLIYCLEEDNIHPDSKYWYLTRLAAKCTAKRMVPDYVSEKILLRYKYPIKDMLTIQQRRDQWGDESIWGTNPFKGLTDEECKTLTDFVMESEKYRRNGLKAPYNAEAAEIMSAHHIVERDVKPLAYPSMGCRSFLTPDPIHMKYYGRMNQGVVTTNLVDTALTAIFNVCGNYESYDIATQQEEVMAEFWKVFDERMELCHRALQCRHNRLMGTSTKASPIHWQFGALARLSKDDTIDKLLFDNYSTISLGYAGLYECVYAITGQSHTSSEGKPFAMRIMQALNDYCAKWRAAENISYSLYGTPMESTTYKFATCLQKRFGVIPGVTDHEYITNSYHVNVREHIDPYTKLKFEGEFQRLSPGGCISYVETVNLDRNIDAVLNVMQYIYDNTMYAELNTKSDYCQVCGYDGEIKIVEDEKTGRHVWECPSCGNRDPDKMNIARRVCGYISSNSFNQGRTEEIRDRYVHLGSE